MNQKQTLSNIWAMTDKPVMDKMAKNVTLQSPSTITVNDSSDVNSDSESLDSSYGYFAAVPKEFRPPLPMRTKTEPIKISPVGNKQIPSKQTTSASTNTAQKTPSKIALLENQTPEPINLKKMPHQKETPTFKKGINLPKPPADLQKMHQVASDVTNTQNKVDVKNNSGVNEKISFQHTKKLINNSGQRPISHQENPNYENGKNKIQYEYVQKEAHITVNHNFKRPSKPNLYFNEDGLKPNLENKKQQKKCIFDKSNKNLHNAVEQLYKGSGTLSYQKNKIRWDSCLNLKEISNGIDKFERHFDKDELSNQENVVKWDNSLNLKEQSNNTKGKIEYNFGKDIRTAPYQENRVKWHNSLIVELNNDTENEIEWTIIEEKKTTISSKKIQDKNRIQKKIHNEYLATKPCRQKTSRKWNGKKNFNLKPCINHRKDPPKPDPHNKHTENQLKNALQLNNDLKNTDIQNPDTQKNLCLDTETFTQKFKVNEEILENQVSPKLSNEKSEFIINSNIRKDDNWGSDIYQYKNDYDALKHIEDQKKSMLHYSGEMSDLIIGSYTALSLFISMFNEWKQLRLELIQQFEYIEKNLKESSKSFTKYKDMLSIVQTGTTLATAIPLPHASIAAKVIGLFTTLFSVFLTNKEQKKAEVENPNDISLAASKDTNASADMYLYGLQCGQNFEEASKLIEEFHSNAEDPAIFESDSPEIATFLRGVLVYKPRHRIFYKKLHKCFQELLHNSTSEFSRRFCEPFLLYSPEVIDVVGFLDWRFRHEDFNSESVRYELEQIQYLIGEKDTSIKQLTISIQNCIKILEDELKYLEGCVKDIAFFDNSMQTGNKIF